MHPISAMPNYFAIFQLPEQFALKKQTLDTAYQEILADSAPDDHPRIHLAYHTLCSPIKRAIHLCDIKGHPLDNTDLLSFPADFYIEQIEWRQLLDNARIEKKTEAMTSIGLRLQEAIKMQMQQIEQVISAQHFASAIQEIRKILFLEKLAEEISHLLDQLE